MMRELTNQEKEEEDMYRKLLIRKWGYSYEVYQELSQVNKTIIKKGKDKGGF